MRKTYLFFSGLLNILSIAVIFSALTGYIPRARAVASEKKIVNITPPVLETVEEKYNRHLFWYDYNGDLSIVLDSARAYHSQIKVFLAKETTDSIHWLRVCYLTCTNPKDTSSCKWVNFAHLKPVKIEDGYVINTTIYSRAKMKNRSPVALLPKEHMDSNLYNYVIQFFPICIVEEERTGIPWPIKLGQGIMESGINSDLATIHGNHFGIKTHRGWKGKSKEFGDEKIIIKGKVVKKKYGFCHFDNPFDSYVYHSKFLMNNRRYRSAWNYQADSIYTYTHKPIARSYWNPKIWKPVYTSVCGKKVLLEYGKSYRMTGIECWATVLSTAGYASDYYYAWKLCEIIKTFKNPQNSDHEKISSVLKSKFERVHVPSIFSRSSDILQET